MIQARSVGIASGGESCRVDEHAHLHAEFGWLRCCFQPAQTRSFGLALHQAFDAQVVVQHRPSIISTVKVSADVSMRLILRSEKLITFLQYQRFVGFNDPGDLSQIMRPKSMIDRQPTR